MAQINKPNLYFNTKLYTGTGSAQSITGVGFQPDFVWGKNRSTTNWHDLEDSVRGVTKRLSSNVTDAEATETVNFTSFDTDGFSVGTGANVNGSGNNIVVWNWLADNTSGSSNTDGSITSTVSANTTSGFSIVSYTGNATAGATVGHGLGAVPKMIITKSRNQGTYNWTSYHVSLGNTGRIRLNLTDAAQTGQTNWNSTTPTSSVFSLGTNADVNGSGDSIIAYCFAEKKGFSKFGNYTSNNSSDGPFIYCGFKPAFLLFKNTTSGNTSWHLYDNKRLGYNFDNNALFANGSDAEYTSDQLDILSNGFKMRYVGDNNYLTDNIIYMAFAENPLVGTNNIPATAR